MKILTPSNLSDYALIDSGNDYKLERFGNNTIMRPDTNCVWLPHESTQNWHKKTSISCEKSTQGRFVWRETKAFDPDWRFAFKHTTPDKQEHSLTFQLRFSHSKNIGIFPEQAANWRWMMDIISQQATAPNVLNLFAYTGGATLAAASAGAQVCHVDAARSAINTAKRNQELSGIPQDAVRWIVDDCTAFVTREIKRKRQYDAIIMDPPAFGRTPQGKTFSFQKHIRELLPLCKQVLRSKPLFFIFNGYSMGYSATVLKNVLHDVYPQHNIEFGELHLAQDTNKKTLPCSLFARFSTKK